ncbi:MAG: hypothetical protein JWR16_3546 [Nevskia sp.]|nr:hypothetical protein [Nevskia sp.]
MRALSCGLITALAACTGASNDAVDTSDWPSAALSADNAVTVDPQQFLSAAQLQNWQVDLDHRGLRATGTTAHENYIDALYQRLAAAGVKQLSFEAVPLMRWAVDSWSLDIVGGASAGAVATAAYIPYAGVTPANGVTAPLVYLSSKTTPSSSNAGGKIVLFDVPLSSVKIAEFELLAMRTYDPKLTLSPLDTYARSYLGIGSVTTLLDQLQAAGAVGAIGVIAAPAATAHGTYFPYDRKLRQVPSLFVDQTAGALLKQVADGGTHVRLTLPAEVKQVQTRNLIGIIPGASDELTVINSHTDGTNGIEDNGPNAIVAMSQYLTRLPQQALPRSIMILLSSGHFAGGIGAETFLANHGSDGLLNRIASIITIEHLGAQEWLPDANGLLAPTGKPEPGAFFMPKIQALVDASYAMLKNADAAPAFVLPPLNSKGDGSADDAVWPGEGQYFWGEGNIPTANYITGPAYLLNWGVTTADKVDYDRMRREAIAFTQMQLDLSRVPASDLHKLSAFILPLP